MASMCARLCRTCLAEDSTMISIFDESVEFENLPYSNIILATTDTEMTDNDGMPTVICESCKHSATEAYKFKLQSKKAYTTLKDLIFKDKTLHMKCDTVQAIKTEHQDIKFECSNDEDDTFDCNDFIGSNAEMFCDIDATSKEEVQNEDSQPFFCTFCKKTFEKKEALNSHVLICIKDESEDTKTTICQICNLNLGNSQECLDHIVIYHSSIEFDKNIRKPERNTKKSKVKHKQIKIENEKLEEMLPEVTTNCSNGQKRKRKIFRPRCEICNMRFTTQLELNVHFENHNGGDVFCCKLCDKIYFLENRLKEHLRTHEEACNSNICDKSCEELDIKPSINTEEILNVQQFFKKEFVKKCTVSELISNRLETTMEATPMNLQSCGKCCQLFLSEEEREQHNHTDHIKLLYHCHLCTKVFVSAKLAERHESCCKMKSYKHECQTCCLKFTNELTLNKHILKEHKGQTVSFTFSKHDKKLLKCRTCDQTFFKKEIFEEHMKGHRCGSKTFECDVCKKKFNRKDNLRSHMQIHNPKEIKIPSNCLCLYCGRAFSNSSNLIVHMRRHTGEKPYKCDYCGKGFPRSSDLTCHRRMHTGEKPYLCNICGKGFRRNNKLSRHMRVHTGLRPYKCTYCEKAFSQSNDLTLHVRRHTGDKPYVCDVCGERFIQGGALRSHRRTHNHFPPSTSAVGTSTFTVVAPKQAREKLVKTVLEISNM